MMVPALDAIVSLYALRHYCMTSGMLRFHMLLKSFFPIKATAKGNTVTNNICGHY